MPFARAVPALLRCAVAAAPALLLAVETPSPTPTTSPPLGVNGSLTSINDFVAGRSAMGAGRQIVVQGLLDLDALQRQNFTDGNGSISDHRGYGLIRAELDLKVKLDEKATVVVGVGYKGNMGDYGITNQTPGPQDGNTNPTDESPVKSEQSIAVISQAYVHLKEFLGFEELGVLAGRMPVNWNLVADRGAFLFDSRAHDPAIGSWDGVRAGYTMDTLTISPWVFRLPDSSALWGGTFDWKPVTTGGSDQVLVTGTFAEQRHIWFPDSTLPGNGVTGKYLRNYAGGVKWRGGDVEMWGEGSAQRGDAGLDRSIHAWGGEAGLDWQWSQYGKGKLMLIGEYLTGDDDKYDETYTGYTNTWNTISDTLLVENWKYGGLAGLLNGNLRAFKARWGVGFDERDSVRIDLTGAMYRLGNELESGGGKVFGSELDTVLRWQYTYNTQIRLLGGLVKPGGGMTSAMEEASTTPGFTAGRDLIWMFGANLNVSF